MLSQNVEPSGIGALDISLRPEMKGWSIKVNDEVNDKDLMAPRDKQLTARNH